MDSEPSTKTVLINEIHSFGKCFLISLAATHLLYQDFAIEHLKGAVLDVEGSRFKLTPLGKLLETEGASKPSVQIFLKSCYRACLCETYESILKYCEKHGHSSLLEKEDWFYFVNFVRNALRHNFTFTFWPSQRKKKLPVSWNGKTITKQMEGAPLTFGFLGFEDLKKLYSAMERFARDRLP